MERDREFLRETFDSAAARYQRARPEYPAPLIDELVRLADLRPGSQLLELGCATGKATAPLAERGYRITCIELGGELAAAAQKNLAGYLEVEVVHTRFEDYLPDSPRHFDLVYAANAWHWLDPESRYRRAHELLRPGGHLAFWGASHVFPDDGDSFFLELQPIYEEIGEGMAPNAVLSRPKELPDQRAEIEASGLFSDIAVAQFDWELSYDADRYIDLLDTFSGHIAMKQWQRERLYGEIRRRLGLRPDGLLRRHWGTALHVARRRR